MFRFGNPEYMYLLLLIPFLIGLFGMARYYKKRAIRKFGDIEILQQLMPFVSRSRPVLKFVFFILAFTSLILALADPQFGSKLEKVKRKGAEIIIALDVSNSMLAEDIQPNRLERAKQSISKLIDRLENDRIGLIVFAGDAYIQVPVTSDFSAAKMFLSSINTQIVSKQGTSIGTAIDLAMNSFTPETEMDKAVIIITDGENHEDNPVKAAELAAKKGIQIHTIGMGSSKGTPIPVHNTYGQTTFLKDNEGNVVVSKLDQKTLQQIAVAGEGMFIMANNTQAGLNKLFDEISRMEKEEMEEVVYTEFEHRFQYLVGIALFFLMVEVLIPDRKSKWAEHFNLFKINQ
ncbi:MAG: VWA domain-containing protein [Bacteroidales bacterium]|jgi:Ca-activated chloride channel family protein|nr:VWA domain-containing protein [Bacteroidales bacterium]